jgi:hypothetical protein
LFFGRARIQQLERLTRLGKQDLMTQEFDVVQSFVAVAAISGAQRQFGPGDRIICNTAPDGPTITFQVESTFFLVERGVFELSCKRRNSGLV